MESTGKLQPRAIELQSVAGAYWRGDETKAMLQVRKARFLDALRGFIIYD